MSESEQQNLVEVVLTLAKDIPIVNIEANAKKTNRKNKESSSYVVKNEYEIEFSVPEEAIIGEVFVSIYSSCATTLSLTNIAISLSEKSIKYDENTTTIKEIIEQSSSKKLNCSLNLKEFNGVDVSHHVTATRQELGFVDELFDEKSAYSKAFPTNFNNLPLIDNEETKAEEKEEEKEAAKTIDDAIAEDAAKKVKNEQIKLTEEQAEDLKQLFNDLSISKKQESNVLSSAVVAENYKKIVKPCVKEIIYTKYNPVPTAFRLRGHVAYLSVVTLENEIFNITAATEGFFLSNSTNNKFDPSKKADSKSYTSLISLLLDNSKNFISHLYNQTTTLKSLPKNSYISPSTGQLNRGWMFNNDSYNGDLFNLVNREINQYEISSDEADIFAKWLEKKKSLIALVEKEKEEDESVDEKESMLLKQQIYIEKVQLEKELIQCYEIFEKVTLKTIMKLASGEIKPIDESFIYINNGIAYKCLDDNIDVSSGYYSCYSNITKILHSITNVTACNLRYQMCIIVDFAGKRFIAETFSPDDNVHTSESSDEFVYGLNPETQEWVYGEQVLEEVKKISKHFHVKSIEVDGKEVVPLDLGIVQQRGKNYLSKLPEFLPTDINFQKNSPNYPVDKHPVFNYQLIQSWATKKVLLLSEEERKALNETSLAELTAIDFTNLENDLNFKDLNDHLHNVVIPKFVDDICSNDDIPTDSEHLVSKLHAAGINIRYLSEIISKAEQLASKENKDYEALLKENEVKNVEYAKYNEEIQEKATKLYIDRQKEIQKLLTAGKPIPEEMKFENMDLDKLLDIRKPNRETPRIFNFYGINTLITLGEYEILARSIKHLVRDLVIDLPLSLVTSLLTYIYNLLFGFEKENVKFEFLDSYFAKNEYKFSSIITNRASLITAIQKKAELYFSYVLEESFIDEATNVKPFVLIKAINKQLGCQILNRKYFFTAEQYESYVSSLDKKLLKTFVKDSNTFNVNDFTLIPKVKKPSPDAEITLKMWNTALASLSQPGNENIALVMMSESINSLEDTYGSLNFDSAIKLLTLIRTVKEDNLTVNGITKKSLVSLERLIGADSYITINALQNAALLSASENNFHNSVVYFNRLVEIAQSVLLNGHSIVLNTLNQLSSLATLAKDIKTAIKLHYLHLELLENYTGLKSVAYPIMCSKTANLLSINKEFKQALALLVKAKPLYDQELGADHEFSLTCASQINALEQTIEGQKAQSKLTEAQAPKAPAPKKKSKKAKK